jgi:2-oxoglutarate dehydrogenase E2 component (dihydrolipoamide succinyltransferase)
MAIVDIKVPPVGESITEVVIGSWLKNNGVLVKEDEEVVSIESDKVNTGVPAPAKGALKILKSAGQTAVIGEIIAQIDTEAQVSGAMPSTEQAPAQTTVATQAQPKTEAIAMPAARRVLAENNLSAADVQGTGLGGRVLKEDVVQHVKSAQTSTTQQATTQQASSQVTTATIKTEQKSSVTGSRVTETVAMTPLRKTVARRLLEAQQNAAILTTFNEVDMSNVMQLRNQYKDSFLNKHGVKLGFMSFFVRAVVEALKEYPSVNAKIENENIIYHHYYDIGIAVGGGKGLVVPVLRNTESLSLAEIEKAIVDFGTRAKQNQLKFDELTGGTFSITNGGIYGSLLSTPILNPPQSGILGMHGIQDRPIAVNGQVVIRPMMYIALSYDHRIVDGREAVSFLKRVKELVEDPSRILIEA